MRLAFYFSLGAYALTWFGCARALLVGYDRRVGRVDDWFGVLSLVSTAALWPVLAVVVAIYGFGFGVGHLFVRLLEMSILERNRAR